uniref:Uncharacterized protein n=1 Tax=Romanomermis culicivorax TaxID=13658 RepID=A0A915JII3_ROMCU
MDTFGIPTHNVQFTNISRFLEFWHFSVGDPEALHGDVSRKIGSKSDQWFGATVVALNTDDDSQSAVVNIQQFSPCKVKHRLGYHRLGYCMAGFSAAIGKDNNIFLGEPGAYYWGGAVSTKSTNFAKPATHTQNGSKEYDDQFMGYSSAVGDFNGDNIDDVAVGVPRGNFLMGKVVLYNDRLENLVNLTGDQMGSYFGASIAVADLNGDKLHDIIVGAPLFINMETGSAGVQSTYEIGRVYVYFQSPTHTFDKPVTINGHREWGRFGYDVAAAGDLNQDGYNGRCSKSYSILQYNARAKNYMFLTDFVVGAPLDGLDRKSGAVYIYNGAKNGIREKYSQVIYGQSIQTGIETFGFSVSGGRDVDNNGYPGTYAGNADNSAPI